MTKIKNETIIPRNKIYRKFYDKKSKLSYDFSEWTQSGRSTIYLSRRGTWRILFELAVEKYGQPPL